MSEDFLYFLWQFQYFQCHEFRTTGGEQVQVIHPGYRNTDAGPDFTNAHLLIGHIKWVGTVEAHIRTSDWLTHRHGQDRVYDTVILHIVWEDDSRSTSRIPIRRNDGSEIPTVCLSGYTDHSLLYRYQKLTQKKGVVPCSGHLTAVLPLHWTAMLDKSVLERLERKVDDVIKLYRETGHDWEETIYQTMATAFGFHLNADPFRLISRQLPIRIVQKHRLNGVQVEALFFGIAGFLENSCPTDYEMILQREYNFLAYKYGLKEKQLPAHVWKWSKLRPANFPILRLAQFAHLLSSTSSLLTQLIDTRECRSILQWFQVKPSPYWQEHYRFGDASDRVPSVLGVSTAIILLINTVVPLLAAYATCKGQPEYLERAVDFLETLPAEQNKIIRLWKKLGMPIRTAFDSQALLELYTYYCQPKKCLSCQIGMSIIKK